MNKATMQWWLLFCLQALFVSLAIYFRIHEQIWEADWTKLSFGIAGIWLVSSIFFGYWHRMTDPEKISSLNRRIEVGWYLSELCMALGMVGTVVGFLLMLGTSFTNIDVQNTASLQQALSSMAQGMSTALYTTLVGLIASIFMKSQLINLEYMRDGLQK